MTGDSRPDDARRTGDAIERVIDEALESALRAGPVDLRSRVLASLDEPRDDRRSPWSVVFRPALLPVAGAILLAVGVAITWRHVDAQLTRAGRPIGQAIAHRTSAPPVRPATSPAIVPVPDARPTGAAAVLAARPAAAETPTRSRRGPVSGEDRVVASAWLAMDAASRPAGVTASAAIAGDEPGPSLPGAPAGNLGDPIAPMPRLRPIVIPPIVTAPIVEAPPISSLGNPVGTLSTDDVSRDRSDPGKPGGVHP